ncbi:MAG: NHL repeat-containing protein [Candidatus Aegiribacteria sp.]|nr:NHL repeat-containing protein [Candidatus Aegiribacteria sp.]
MKIREFDCPSCGASLRIKRNQMTSTCPYCGSSVIVPSELFSGTGTVPHKITGLPITLNTGHVGKLFSRIIFSIVLITLLTGGIVFLFAMKTRSVIESSVDTFTTTAGPSGLPVVLEFGGTGMGAGLFQNARYIAVDANGHIYIGEHETGRIQVFDTNGIYITQWSFGDQDDCYLQAMSASRNGELYLIYGSELLIHDGMTGELLDSLTHPDGWGFDDVEVCDNGSVVASWCKHSDDIIRFSPEGRIDLLMKEAISGQSGDSELSTDITVDGLGNIFAYGSFNESIFKFSSEGRFLNRFGSSGDRPGQFSSLSCICTDPLGRLWVTDFRDLIIFDNDGLYLETINSDYSLYDMVMGDNYQLYGITVEDVIIQLDLSEYIKEL